MTVKARLRCGMTAVLAVLLVALTTFGAEAEEDRPSRGQTLYSPVYSHIYSGDREKPVYLAITLSIRNTDPHAAITLTTVDYYNSEGHPLFLPGVADRRYDPLIRETPSVDSLWLCRSLRRNAGRSCASGTDERNPERKWRARMTCA